MLIDILGQDNNITFNSSIANKIGLNAAIYLSELLKQYSEAQNHKKLMDNYFQLNRTEIFKRTTLTEQLQQELDILLVRLNIILKRSSMLDALAEDMSINMQALINIFASDNEKTTQELTKLVKSKTTTKMSQRDKYKLDLKSKIQHENKELLQAYRDWIDGVYANPKGFLSITSIKAFQRDVDNFAKGDLDLALKIIEIATIHGYREADWAINYFHKNCEADFNKLYNIKPASSVDREIKLSSEVF